MPFRLQAPTVIMYECGLLGRKFTDERSMLIITRKVLPFIEIGLVPQQQNIEWLANCLPLRVQPLEYLRDYKQGPQTN